MEEVRKKIVKMSDEIIKYFLLKKGEEIDLNIKEMDEKYVIFVRSKVDISNKEMEELHFKISNHRDVEYDFYWELVGETYDDDELVLLSLISDKVDISYKENIMSFIIELNK